MTNYNKYIYYNFNCDFGEDYDNDNYNLKNISYLIFFFTLYIKLNKELDYFKWLINILTEVKIYIDFS